MSTQRTRENELTADEEQMLARTGTNRAAYLKTRREEAERQRRDGEDLALTPFPLGTKPAVGMIRRAGDAYPTVPPVVEMPRNAGDAYRPVRTSQSVSLSALELDLCRTSGVDPNEYARFTGKVNARGIALSKFEIDLCRANDVSVDDYARTKSDAPWARD